MKVKIFGPEIFESKWVPRPRGWLAHTFLCDGQVAVHDAWYGQGYGYAVVYDHTLSSRGQVLDWLQEHAAGEHILHPSGAALFKDQLIASSFRQQFA